MKKSEIVKAIFELTDNKEAQAKLKNNYHYMRFLGLDFNYNSLKYAMAIDLNKFTSFEYINTLNKIKEVLESWLKQLKNIFLVESWPINKKEQNINKCEF